jgi:hypothetical protein
MVYNKIKVYHILSNNMQSTTSNMMPNDALVTHPVTDPDTLSDKDRIQADVDEKQRNWHEVAHSNTPEFHNRWLLLVQACRAQKHAKTWVAYELWKAYESACSTKSRALEKVEATRTKAAELAHAEAVKVTKAAWAAVNAELAHAKAKLDHWEAELAHWEAKKTHVEAQVAAQSSDWPVLLDCD